MLTYHAVSVFLFGGSHYNDRHAQVDLLPLWRLTLGLPVPSSFVSVETHCVSFCTPISVRRATEFISTSPDPPSALSGFHSVTIQREPLLTEEQKSAAPACPCLLSGRPCTAPLCQIRAVLRRTSFGAALATHRGPSLSRRDLRCLAMPPGIVLSGVAASSRPVWHRYF
jgi:hypothetical protein